jgi:hypothetical protein
MGLDLLPRMDYPGISLYRSTVPTVMPTLPLLSLKINYTYFSTIINYQDI